jgi:SAM-dependent methyltransferase
MGLTAEDVLNWDVRTWSAAVAHWHDALGDPGRSLDCIEVGAGPGGPSLWLAAQGHRVICSNRDYTEELATPLHSRHPEASTITYRDVDITEMPWEAAFDVVIFKSVIGGIHPTGRAAQEAAVAQIHKILKPGGLLLFAENQKGTVAHQWARDAAYRRRPGPPWKYVSLADTRELLAGFRDVRLETTGFLALFGNTEGRRAGLAAMDERVFNRITPRASRYVVYGSAIK